MKTKKEKVIRNFLRIIFSIAIIGLAVNCPKLEAYAVSTVDVKIVGHSWYGAAKLMVDEINQLRKQNGVPALTLDADLQEWATQISAEMLFYPNMATSNIRPDGTSVYSTLVKKPVLNTVIIGKQFAASSDEECKTIVGEVLYKSRNPDITSLSAYTSIGIGLYQEKAEAFGRAYIIVLLGMGDSNQSNFKNSAENEVRTINTLSSYFKLCNGGERVLDAGDPTDKIILDTNESFVTTLFQHTQDGYHVKLESTQATYRVNNPAIASVVPTANGIKVTGLSAGNTTFTASLGGQTATYYVTVNSRENQQSSSTKKPSVSKLKDLPKNYQGPAIVGGEEVYVKNQKKYSGTCKINGKTYLYKNGKKFTGTKKGIYYKGGVKYTGWKKKGGKKYYYSKGKLIKKKFKTISGKKYYFNKSGIMQKGQVKVKGKYYYFNKSGVMQKNKWIKIKGRKYYFNKKGVRTKKKKA